MVVNLINMEDWLQGICMGKETKRQVVDVALQEVNCYLKTFLSNQELTILQW